MTPIDYLNVGIDLLPEEVLKQWCVAAGLDLPFKAGHLWDERGQVTAIGPGFFLDAITEPKHPRVPNFGFTINGFEPYVSINWIINKRMWGDGTKAYRFIRRFIVIATVDLIKTTGWDMTLFFTDGDVMVMRHLVGKLVIHDGYYDYFANHLKVLDEIDVPYTVETLPQP